MMLETAKRAAREAGRLLLAAAKKDKIEVDRFAVRDIKLAMDREAEEAIINIIRADFPGHSILSEECGSSDTDSEYRWVIDPLDGTYNFYRRIPVWCTSIGLVRGGAEILGVIYDPNRDEMFYAAKGDGAYLNDKPIRVADTPSFADSVIGIALGLRPGHEERALRAAHNVVQNCSKGRSLGSAALDMAYVACGRFDGYAEIMVRTWDVAAGLVIVREAGGQASVRRHANESLEVAVSNGRIHDEFLRQIEWQG
jgi:myo-inositol-1(or 4)-monophosphatase